MTDRARHGGQVEELAALRLGEVLVAHRAVGGAEIHGLLADLLLAAAGADGLVVDLDGGIDLAVGVEPLGVEWVREGRACAVDRHLGLRARRAEGDAASARAAVRNCRDFHARDGWV